MKTGLTITKDNTAALFAGVEAMMGRQVLVGVPAEKFSRNDDMNNAALGFVHENGSPAANVPARPFLVPGVREAGSACVAAMKPQLADALTNPAATERALNAAGLVAQAAVRNRLVAQTDLAPLAPSTIAARKRAGIQSDKALIRTGQMLRAITYVVREKPGVSFISVRQRPIIAALQARPPVRPSSRFSPTRPR